MLPGALKNERGIKSIPDIKFIKELGNLHIQNKCNSGRKVQSELITKMAILRE